MLNSYPDFIFEISKKPIVVEIVLYSRDCIDISLVNRKPIAVFSNFILTTSSGKHLEVNNHDHMVSSMYKLLSSSRRSDDLYISFDRDRNRRRDKLTSNKSKKIYIILEFCSKTSSVFRKIKKKVTHGLAYKLTLTRNKD